MKFGSTINGELVTYVVFEMPKEDQEYLRKHEIIPYLAMTREEIKKADQAFRKLSAANPAGTFDFPGDFDAQERAMYLDRVDELHKTIDGLHTTIQERNVAADQKNTIIMDLKKEIHTLEVRVDNQKGIILNRDKEIEELAKRKIALQADDGHKANRIEELEAQNQNQKTIIQDLEQTIKELADINTDLEADRSSDMDLIGTLQEQIDEWQALFRNETVPNPKPDEAWKAIEHGHREQQRVITRLKSDLEFLTTKKNDLLNENVEYQDSIVQLEKETLEMVKHRDKVIAELTQVRKWKDSEYARAEKMSSECLHRARRLEEKSEKIGDLNLEIQKQGQQIAILEDLWINPAFGKQAFDRMVRSAYIAFTSFLSIFAFWK